MIRLLTLFRVDRVDSHDETQVKSIARLGICCVSAGIFSENVSDAIDASLIEFDMTIALHENLRERNRNLFLARNGCFNGIFVYFFAIQTQPGTQSRILSGECVN